MDNLQLTVRIPEIAFHIQTAIRKYQGELDENVALGVEKALRGFDFNAVVSREIDEGLRAAIKTIITQAISRMMYSTEFNEQVEKLLRQSLRKS